VAIDGAKRSPLLPDVPIYAEAGLGNYPIHTWMGLFAPAETPDAIIVKVNQVVGEAIREPKVTEFLVNQLIEPDVTTAPEFAAYVAHEREETGALLRKFNIPKIQ
jgi:tripartite-type tricarboxylate transporter receptor subunit TctC